MNLRLKTYLLLIPPTLLLGVLYLLSLLLFNRRDAYESVLSQIEDRTSIIEAFIESEHPDSIEALSAYLNTKLRESQEQLLKNSTFFRIQIRDSGTHQILYSWTQDHRIETANDSGLLDPDPASEDPQSCPLPTGHHYSEIRPLRLNAFDPPLELVFVAPHPLHVFLDLNFWLDVAVVLILLIFLGGLLSEIVVRIIRRGLAGVDIDATKLADFADLKTRNKGSRIQELDELSNSINTLFDSYEAKRAEKQALLSNPQPMPESSDFLQRIREHSQISDSIDLDQCSCTLWKTSNDSTSYVSFLFRRESKGIAFVGHLNSSALGFESGIIETIVMDTIIQTPIVTDFEMLSRKIDSLRLFRKWTLLQIDPTHQEVKEIHSGEQTPQPEQTSYAAKSKLVIPIGFILTSPIPQILLNSENWELLVHRLFEDHPESAVLCIDS